MFKTNPGDAGIHRAGILQTLHRCSPVDIAAATSQSWLENSAEFLNAGGSRSLPAFGPEILLGILSPPQGASWLRAVCILSPWLSDRYSGYRLNLSSDDLSHRCFQQLLRNVKVRRHILNIVEIFQHIHQLDDLFGLI